MKCINMNKGLLIFAFAIAGCGQTNSPGSMDKASVAAATINKAGPQLDQVQSIEEVNAYRCGNGHQIYICHIPPGNSAERHTLCVGAPAVAAHIKHHKAHDSQLSDYVGQCVGDSSSGGSDPTTGDSGATAGDGGATAGDGGATAGDGGATAGSDATDGGGTTVGSDPAAGGDTSTGSDSATDGGTSPSCGDLGCTFPSGSDLIDPWYSSL
jgi:hypothetical protein